MRFQFLRFARLYPVHLLFLSVFIFIELAKYFAEIKLGIHSNYSPFETNNITALFQQIFLTQAIGPTGKAYTFNIPAWSISVEFYTYFIFGFIILFAKKEKNIIFIFCQLSLFFLITKKTYGFELLLKCISGFFIGCLTLTIINRLKFKVPNYSSIIILLLILLFFYLGANQHYDFLIYFFTTALIVSFILSKNGYLNNLLNNKILTFLVTIYMQFIFHIAQ